MNRITCKLRTLYSRRHARSRHLAAAAVFGERIIGLGMLLALTLITFLILNEAPLASIPGGLVWALMGGNRNEPMENPS